MKSYGYKIIFCVAVFLAFQQLVYSQESATYINLNYILKKLTFTSRISHPTLEINDKLIKEILKRKVDFLLTEEDEKSIKEAGGNDELIKTIRESLPKEIEKTLRYYSEADVLYRKFLDNRKGPEIEKYKIAIQAAKEYIEKYGGGDFCNSEIIEYLKKYIPKIQSKIQEVNNFPR